MIFEPFYTKAQRDARYQELKAAVNFCDVTKFTRSESTGQKYLKRYTPGGRPQWRYTGHIVWYVVYNEVQ